MKRKIYALTVRFLVTRSGTVTTELLWLTASGIGNKETFVVLNEQLFELSLGGLIVILLVEGDKTL